MRIAFVSPNREHLPDPVLPLGVLYMMSVAGEQHERTLIDLCFEPEPLRFLAHRLREFRPDLVAVSMRNIQNADYTDTGTTLGYYDQVVGTIRECTAAPVAMGGGGFSVIPQELMQRYGLDYGIVGDAHAGPWHRQVSLLAAVDVETMRRKGLPDLKPGDFAENCHWILVLAHSGECISRFWGVKLTDPPKSR